MADPLPQDATGFENPTQISVGMLNLPDGGSRVTLDVKNNVVQTTLVLTPKEAAAIGEALQQVAAKLKTGLLVPTGSSLIS